MPLPDSPVQGDLQQQFEGDLGTPDGYKPELELPRSRVIQPVYSVGRVPRISTPRAEIELEYSDDGSHVWRLLAPGDVLNLPIQPDAYSVTPGPDVLKESPQPDYWAQPIYFRIQVNNFGGSSTDVDVILSLQRANLYTIADSSFTLGGAGSNTLSTVLTRGASGLTNDESALLPVQPLDLFTLEVSQTTGQPLQVFVNFVTAVQSRPFGYSGRIS